MHQQEYKLIIILYSFFLSFFFLNRHIALKEDTEQNKLFCTVLSFDIALQLDEYLLK